MIPSDKVMLTNLAKQPITYAFSHPAVATSGKRTLAFIPEMRVYHTVQSRGLCTFFATSCNAKNTNRIRAEQC